jgi:hypothetical protein
MPVFSGPLRQEMADRDGPARAFSSEVDPGSREENASKEESRVPFRFNRNGKGSREGRSGWVHCRLFVAVHLTEKGSAFLIESIIDRLLGAQAPASSH